MVSGSSTMTLSAGSSFFNLSSSSLRTVFRAAESTEILQGAGAGDRNRTRHRPDVNPELGAGFLRKPLELRGSARRLREVLKPVPVCRREEPPANRKRLVSRIRSRNLTSSTSELKTARNTPGSPIEFRHGQCCYRIRPKAVCCCLHALAPSDRKHRRLQDGSVQGCRRIPQKSGST